MKRLASRWGRVTGSALVFAILLWRLGAGPFVDGVRTIDGRALLAAACLAVPTTVCCAWRWKIVSEGLGVELPLRSAVAAYYRSLFLNVTLPGGVVGDVHRAVTHGRDVSNVGGAARAVVWERFAGQVIQAVLTVAVLLALPSPVHAYMPLAALALVIAATCVVLITRRRFRMTKLAWPRVAILSAVIVGGHALTFLIAARTAGVTAPASQVLPLALLVMVVMVIPSVGGWGPREGAAAWAFAAAGLGADQGVATAVAYGVMVFVACLPGAAVLVVSWLRQSEQPLAKRAAHA